MKLTAIATQFGAQRVGAYTMQRRGQTQWLDLLRITPADTEIIDHTERALRLEKSKPGDRFTASEVLLEIDLMGENKGGQFLLARDVEGHPLGFCSFRPAANVDGVTLDTIYTFRQSLQPSDKGVGSGLLASVFNTALAQGKAVVATANTQHHTFFKGWGGLNMKEPIGYAKFKSSGDERLKAMRRWAEIQCKAISSAPDKTRSTLLQQMLPMVITTSLFQ